VAHAFTTHTAEPQRDYFTAVDDWLDEAETGSGCTPQRVAARVASAPQLARRRRESAEAESGSAW
ncbi:type I-E CRISPR-associated protein Cas7/Cse4/CasC, partial [Streptomyces sp. NPDC001761]